MIKNSKFVKTAIAAAALGFVVMSTQAATISATSTPFASQIFAGTAPATAVTLATGGFITVNAITALPTGSRVTVMLKLNGAKFTVADPTTVVMRSSGVTDQNVAGIIAAGGTVTYGSTASGATAATAGTGTATATTNNADTIVVSIVTNQAVGVGSAILALSAPAVSAAGLATAGATVSAEASIYVGAVAATFGAALPSGGKLEADAPALIVATTTSGVTVTAGAATTTQRIDLTATTAAALVTAGTAGATATGSTALIQIGTLAIVDSTTAVTAAGLGNAYAAAALNTTLTLTAPAGYWAGLGTTGVITVRANNATACAGGVVNAATSTAFTTAALAAAATTVSTAAVALGNATVASPLHICMGVIPGTAALVSGAATLTGTLGVAAAQNSAVALTSTALTSLSSNGSTVDVNAYWPASLAAFGYGGFVRVINNGTMAAPISMAYIDSTTGVVGTPAVVVTSLAAGASQMISAATIEAAVGAQPFGIAAGRIRVTAPTTSLRTQTFVQVGNNAPQETSGGQ